MELLTGKAKEKFLNWLSTEMYYLGKEPLSDLFFSALIIEWFDSVGIYLDCPPLIDYNPVKFGLLIDEKIHYSEQKNRVYDSRQEARIAGIKKANEIFNSKF